MLRTRTVAPLATTLLLLLLAYPALAAAPTEFVAEVDLPGGPHSLGALAKASLATDSLLSIDTVSPDQSSAVIYASEASLALLEGMGFSVSLRANDAAIYAAELRAADPALMDYHDYDELTALLHDLETRFPSLAKVYSIGQSVEGRELWAIEISDNAGVNEPGEPEFFYQANMHGDETIGRECVINLAILLLESYGEDEELTGLVNSTNIVILPSMNPDGFERSRRSNARGVDLNRNFPDQFRDPVDSTEGREPETAHVMNFVSSRSFTLSAGHHGGAICLNYPYDGNESGRSQYSATPDDEEFIMLAKTYSFAHANMWDSRQFQDGITNGADWYVLFGGIQDWMYVYRGCMDVTTELSVQKWPPASQLPQYWEDNRDALIQYMSAIHKGVRGFVRDTNGRPLAATITVDSRDVNTYSDSDNGDYYRILMPGTYSITASAPGHASQTQTVVVPADGHAVLDFVLA